MKKKKAEKQTQTQTQTQPKTEVPVAPVRLTKKQREQREAERETAYAMLRAETEASSVMMMAAIATIDALHKKVHDDANVVMRAKAMLDLVSESTADSYSRDLALIAAAGTSIEPVTGALFGAASYLRSIASAARRVSSLVAVEPRGMTDAEFDKNIRGK